MSSVQTAPYGSWRSPITSDLIVADAFSLSDVILDGDDIYWLEGRPLEAGRYVLVCRSPDGAIRDINPPPFNARTRVHEYGGGAVVVAGGTAYFSHFADQRLYLQAVGATPITLTPEPPAPDTSLRYADGLIDGRRQRWLGVREDHLDPGKEAVNTLVAIDLSKGGPGEVLVQGHDFYSSPRLSPDGQKLAWLAWNHPHMPWVETELWSAEVAANGSLANPTRIAGGQGESIFQPEWSPDGRLYFVSDRSGWWNLYRAEAEQAVPLYPLEAEFGQPQWYLGQLTYAFAGPERIVCAYSQRGLGKLAVLDLARNRLTPLELPFTEFASVRAQGNRVAFRASSPTRATSVVLMDLKPGRYQVLRSASAVADQPEINRYFSRPQTVEFPTENGQTAFGLYYPPANPDYQAPAGAKPPLVVKCHGGPTGAASSALDLRTQFWTSRGIAVLDVNYGGSTGFGRAYRDRLQRSWGIIDVDDCVNGAKYLAKQGLVDEQRAVITGGSAGGYTTLAALAFRDFFKGGASHYGVSDLAALARDTHKFESRYLDWLLGPYPAEEKVYRERSPLYSAERIQAPVIFFQGEEDRVVPVNQAERMVDALRANRIPVGYLLFAGEQHGFRKADNIKRALDAELYFYSELVFRVGLAF